MSLEQAVHPLNPVRNDMREKPRNPVSLWVYRALSIVLLGKVSQPAIGLLFVKLSEN